FRCCNERIQVKNEFPCWLATTIPVFKADSDFFASDRHLLGFCIPRSDPCALSLDKRLFRTLGLPCGDFGLLGGSVGGARSGISSLLSGVGLRRYWLIN